MPRQLHLLHHSHVISFTSTTQQCCCPPFFPSVLVYYSTKLAPSRRCLNHSHHSHNHICLRRRWHCHVPTGHGVSLHLPWSPCHFHAIVCNTIHACKHAGGGSSPLPCFLDVTHRTRFSSHSHSVGLSYVIHLSSSSSCIMSYM